MEMFEIILYYLNALMNFLIIVEECGQKKDSIYSDYEREFNGFYENTFLRLKANDDVKFKKLTRMTAEKFDLLLSLLKEKLTKFSNRTPISAECRLGLTVIYLAHGDSRNTLSLSFRTSPTAFHNILYETCEAIWTELSWLYVGEPNVSDWKETADKFYVKTGLPHCVSAIDGKHINIICPPGAGSEYHNYKGHHSIVLMAACDANYSLTLVDIGARGSENDAFVFSRSKFGNKIIRERLCLPQDSLLPNSDVVFPYFFVADGAFPLKPNIMKPYPGRLLDTDKSRYNYIISSTRRYIENAFGIMCARWRILTNTLHCHPKNAMKIVKAVVTLHNFLKLHDESYCPPDFVDHEENGNVIPGAWRSEVTPLTPYRGTLSNNARRESFLLRDKLKDYLNNNTCDI